MKSITKKKILITLIIISNTLTIKNSQIKSLKCSDIKIKFSGYTCPVEKKIGEGASGIAFLAKKEKNNYILKAQKSNGSEIEKNSDLSFLLKLKNIPGVIHIEDYKFENNVLYEVLEFGDLGDLKKNLKTEYFDNQKNIIKFFEELINIIQDIHSEEVIHADIKSDNIVLKSDYSPKFIDFDLSVKLGTKKGGRGTIPYMDPLILESWGKYYIRYGPYIDIFSLGIVLYEVLTKKVVFKGDMSTVYFSQKLGSYTIPKGTIRILAVLIEGCLQRSLKKRFDSDKILDFIHDFYINGSNSDFLQDDVEVDMNHKIFSFDEDSEEKVKSSVVDKGNSTKIAFFFGFCLFCIFIVFGIIFWRIWNHEIKENVNQQTMEISIVNEDD